MDRQRRAAELLDKLAQGGYRRTPQRFYIVEALVGDESHPTAEAIFARVRQACPTTSLATVYKTLETLKEMGEVLELEFSEGSNRYDGLRPAAHPHAHHHHAHAWQASLVTRKERWQRIRRHEKIDRSDDQQDNADQRKDELHKGYLTVDDSEGSCLVEFRTSS